MATNKELEQQIAELRTALASALGLPLSPAVTDPTERADYVPFGSARHATLLGLIPLDSTEEAAERLIYESPLSHKLYCLEDEPSAIRMFPGIDPDKSIPLLLRQKVTAFESGAPSVPDDALPMWTPTPDPMAGI